MPNGPPDHYSGLFDSTSAFKQPDAPPVAPAPAPDIGRITFAHTKRLSEIAEILELARDATIDTNLTPLLDEAIELARRP